MRNTCSSSTESEQKPCSNPNCPIPKEKLDKRTLQIDHVNGKGNEERRTFTSPYQYYHIIYKRILESSEDYQLLCPYCNVLKRIERKESIQPLAFKCS